MALELPSIGARKEARSLQGRESGASGISEMWGSSAASKPSLRWLNSSDATRVRWGHWTTGHRSAFLAEEEGPY